MALKFIGDISSHKIARVAFFDQIEIVLKSDFREALSSKLQKNGYDAAEADQIILDLELSIDLNNQTLIVASNNQDALSIYSDIFIFHAMAHALDPIMRKIEKDRLSGAKPTLRAISDTYTGRWIQVQEAKKGACP